MRGHGKISENLSSLLNRATLPPENVKEARVSPDVLNLRKTNLARACEIKGAYTPRGIITFIFFKSGLSRGALFWPPLFRRD